MLYIAGAIMLGTAMLALLGLLAWKHMKRLKKTQSYFGQDSVIGSDILFRK